jgi:trans-aconitate methyltransferase
MLELARHNIAEFGVNAAVGSDLPERQFDWVNSSIVLQHIPPRRGYEILRRLWQIVGPGGVMSIHLTIYHEGADVELMHDLVRYRYDGEEVAVYLGADEAQVGSMSMYDYDLSRVFATCNFTDGQSVYLHTTIHGANHGVLLFAGKAN